MKKAFILFLLIQVSLFQYAQIIADHTVVDTYDDIPQQYIDQVKKMLVDFSGQSHAHGYINGINLLELLDSRFQVTTYEYTTPPTDTDSNLRLGLAYSAAVQVWCNSWLAGQYSINFANQNATGNPFDVWGFGWCYDMSQTNDVGGGLDPVYNVRWAGQSTSGPEGNLRWGLDAADQVLTGNSVSMDTYLAVVEQWISYCAANSIPTKIIFTTGPVDYYTGENAFQRELKHDHIRDYVAKDGSRILFDYADILCYNNSNVKYTQNWNDGGTLRPYAQIHPDNLKDYDASWNIVTGNDADGDHIGEVGALRLAKAVWWMLARIAGWDGN